MKTRLFLAGGLLLALTGCASYDYVGGGGGGGYYHGAPSTEYRYPYGYPSAYPYGYGGYYGGGGYYGNGYNYPIYRPVRPVRPPPHGGHTRPPVVRPPDQGHRPPPRPPRNNGGAPWRNMDSNAPRPRPPPAPGRR